MAFVENILNAIVETTKQTSVDDISNFSQRQLDDIVNLAHSLINRLCVECGLSIDTISKDEIATKLKGQIKAYEAKFTLQKFFGESYAKEWGKFICFEVQSLVEKKIKAQLLIKQGEAKAATKAQEKRLVAAHLKKVKMAAVLVAINQNGEKISENSRPKRATQKPRQERAENVEVEPKFSGLSNFFDALKQFKG